VPAPDAPAGALALRERAADLWAAAQVVVGAEAVPGADDPGPGYWVGAPSVVVHDGAYVLAYRPRRPVGEGRGLATVVATSPDGVHFTTVASLSKDAFRAESLERPALVRTDGGWRLYVSCATPGTKHWRVDVVEAPTLEELATAAPRTVLPGDERTAVKDPVVLRSGGRWHLWASVHPLDDPAATDRMTTRYATSDDGLAWTWRATALCGRPGTWDARGVRVTAVVEEAGRWWALYDGRASAAENWEERTGLAVGTPEALHAEVLEGGADGPLLQSPHPPHGLRYACRVAGPDGVRWYYEATRADGAHELRTVLLPGT
jgi:hypothetical protein